MPLQQTLRVGAAQINPQLGKRDSNLERHLGIIAEGHALGLDLLVFPELSLTGYGLGQQVPEVACASTDPCLQGLAAAAGSMQTLVGFVEEGDPGEYYNAIAVLQAGRTIAVHRKLNLPSYGGLEEGKWFGAGRTLTQALVRPGWPATHLICADLWNPALVHAAMLSRPCVLCAAVNSASAIVSAGFDSAENWALNLQFYAMTYGIPVIMANRYGTEGSSHFWGGSRILGPRGETLARADDCEMLISAELSLASIARARFELPTLRDANSPLIRELLAGR